MKHLVILITLIATGCGYLGEEVPVKDPRLAPLWKAAESFDRLAYGFSTLPDTGSVILESRSRAGYDAMLHITGKTCRTIAFRRTATGYRWIHEQELFQGPKQYTSVDGTFYEQIVLTFEVEHISGCPTNQLSVSYNGEDPRLTWPKELTLSEVQPILDEWGY